ncbi:MAG: hypothetical protein KDD99_09455, partial [Bacteroidetes bacterium]|nr:hypothetical protein [Bacteroidota bacterium]
MTESYFKFTKERFNNITAADFLLNLCNYSGIPRNYKKREKVSILAYPDVLAMRNSEYEDRLTLLSLRMEAVEGDLSALKSVNQQLRAENASLRAQNAELEAQLAEMAAKLKAYEVVKDSRNSNKPPSQDMIKQTESRRKRSKKSTGGQPGHKG